MSNYHIFKVYDYKGGELTSSINLDREQFIDELSDLLGFDEIIENSTDLEFNEDDTIKAESVAEIINAFPLNDLEFSEYAGYDGVVWEAYESIGDQLVPVDITEELFAECKAHYLKGWE